MSWSSFLLGLTLLDTARAVSLSTATTVDRAGSVFQSQAATARNVGSLTASVLSCLIFGFDRVMNERVVNGIFCATAGCHMISFLLVFCCQESFAPIVQSRRTTKTDTKEQTLSRRPSYAALEIYRDEENDVNSEASIDEVHRPSGSFCNASVVAIVLLQICIIMLALKQQVIYVVTKFPVAVALVACAVGVLALAKLFCSRTRYSGWLTRDYRRCWGEHYMLGLVLILRHAVPSPSAVMYSFLYHCFESQPVWLQVFSLVDNGAGALSSWSYQKLFAPKFSQGNKLITFMMVMTVVAHSFDGLDALIVKCYKEGDALTARSLFPWLVMVIRAVSTFISEWNFLPSVVLATVSATKTSISNASADVDCGEPGQEDSSDGDEQVNASELEPALATNVMYGSFISCIDFGDQLGAIFSTPLVTALGISRENNWERLSTLIFICSGLGVLSASFLLLLGKQSPVPRRVIGFGNASQA